MSDYTNMSAGELLTALGDDADKWAAAFDQFVLQRGLPVDHDTMRAWFANAIVHAQDVQRWRAAEEAERGSK